MTAPHLLPTTPAQRERVGRIVDAANRTLINGGEAALQMKDLAAQADVSLATLYRYFPSKDVLLVALGRARYEAAVRRLANERPLENGTPGTRAADVLLREFRVAEREPAVAAALTRVSTQDAPELRESLKAIARLHEQMIEIAAAGPGGELAPEVRQMIPLLVATFGSAARAWLGGTKSAEQARLEISLACQLLDLPLEQLRISAAAAQVSLRRAPRTRPRRVPAT
jgi:AcrR family transcriptional regulator